MKSLSNCSRFALKSGERMVRPVVFPPGRASEGMSPIPSMSSLLATMDRRGPLLGDAERKVAGWRNHVDLHSNQLSNEFGKLLETARGVAKLDTKIRTLDHSSFAQSLPKRFHARRNRWSAPRPQNTNDARSRLLLRTRGEWPSSRCAAKKRHELAPPCMSRKQHSEG